MDQSQSQNGKDVNLHRSYLRYFGLWDIKGMNHHQSKSVRELNQVIQRTECVTQAMTPYQIFQDKDQMKGQQATNLVRGGRDLLGI